MQKRKLVKKEIDEGVKKDKMERMGLEKIRERGKKGIRMRGDTRAISLTAIVLMLVSLSVFAQSGLAAQISVNPECQIVTNGDYFTVDVYADPEGNATVAGTYNLYFNKTLLNATTQVNGSFLSQAGASTDVVTNMINNTYNATHGVAIYGEYQNGAPYGVTTPGVLGTVTFEALADGFCGLCLGDWGGSKTKLVDTDLGNIPTNLSNGSVRINLCGDVDNDDDVDIFDVFAVYNRYQYGTPLIDEWAADADGDDDIDIFDVFAVYNRYQYGVSLNCRCEA